MSEENEYDWSAWRVWLHPRRAFDSLCEAASLIGEYEHSLTESKARIEEEEKKLGALSLRLEAYREETEKLRGELESTRLQLKEAKEAIKEQEEVEREMMEFDSKLSKAVDMKRGYEKRIAELEYRLRDVWMKNRQPVSDLLDPVDPESLPATEANDIDMSVSTGEAAKPTDLRLDDAVRPDSRRHNETTAPRKDDNEAPSHRLTHPVPPRDAARNDPDGDWLLTLPTDL